MSIIFNAEKKQFHLKNASVSYVMELVDDDYLVHTYFGERISAFHQVSGYPIVQRSPISPNPTDRDDRQLSLNNILQEFPGFGRGDYREAAFEATYQDGTKATSFKYKTHQIYSGKPTLAGLPSTYVNDEDEAETLEITLVDSYRNLAAILIYTIYEQRNVVTKSVRFENHSEGTLYLNRAFSTCLDFDDANYEMIQLTGEWGRENNIQRDQLSKGMTVLDSKRGVSSVAQQPFVALVSPGCDEFQGEVWASHLVYSGSFKTIVEVDSLNQTRVLMGINDHNFSWKLNQGASFQTPEIVHVYSNEGLNGMSQTFHKLYRERLVRGEHQFAERPILINNWEATYFDFNEDQLLELALKGKELGVELFVLDDGWFGKRDDDDTSLGDWYVNHSKLNNGLAGLVEKIHGEGLKFGLWFEPEMVSRDSDLFRKHPDWHIHVDDYPSSGGRGQLVLDFSRKEVRDEIFRQLTAILDEVPIDYIKWDLNRNITELGSVGRSADTQMETGHRYILGLYELFDKLIQRYPTILFENCASGAGRFDPGMAYYMPQTWGSDSTDAMERLKIQYGTSLVFPPIMICSHISEAPNHQVGRITDLKTRAAMAMSGNLGIIYDLMAEEKENLQLIAESIAWYKKNREVIQFGEFHRLISPFDTNYGAWQFIDGQKESGIVFFFEVMSSTVKPFCKVKLTNLDKDGLYNIEGKQLSGDELMKYGLYLNHELYGDFQAKVIPFHKVN